MDETLRSAVEMPGMSEGSKIADPALADENTLGHNLKLENGGGKALSKVKTELLSDNEDDRPEAISTREQNANSEKPRKKRNKKSKSKREDEEKEHTLVNDFSDPRQHGP